jgi:hypothetical protein
VGEFFGHSNFIVCGFYFIFVKNLFNMSTISIDLSLQQLIEAVRQLSPADKMKLSEIIWNSDAPIPPQHQRLVLERKAQSVQDANTMIDWE